MSFRCSRLFLALTLLVAAPCLAAAEGKAPPKGDPAKGKTVYTRNCLVCHNADGSGGKKLTPNGNPSRDFSDPKFWEQRTDEQVRDVIHKGVAKSGMIAWKGILKPGEIEDVIAYIKTFSRKADPAARTAPATESVKP